MTPAKVFIDANVVKFAATKVRKLVPHMELMNWAGKIIEVAISRIVEFNPNDSISNPKLKVEAALLPKLAEAGNSGLLKYLVSFEAQAESWRMPNIPATNKWFYGVPIEKAKPPVHYIRTYAGKRRSPKDLQYSFLSSLKHQRFIELQKASGAYQGNLPPNRNQLLDAFHLWCAEHNDCQFFLTLDFKLSKVLEKSHVNLNLRVVRPSELLAHLNSTDASSVTEAKT